MYFQPNYNILEPSFIYIKNSCNFLGGPPTKLQRYSYHQLSYIIKIIVDLYNGIIDDNLKEDYTFLLKEEYLVNINGKIYSNVPYLGKEFTALMKEINKDLYGVLKEKSQEIYNKIEIIVKKSLSNSSKEYVH